MKKILLGIAIFILFVFASCGTPESPETPSASGEPAMTPALTPTPTPTPTPTLTPTPTPTPTPPVFGEEPDRAGEGDVLFDIYEHTALVDLNKDGTPEELEFTAGSTSSTFSINGTDYTVNKKGLAQRFGITDVNKSDNILEIAFTDKYDPDLADSEKAFTYLYWWKNTKIISMGGLMDVKFDGSWRSSFDPKKHFNATGQVTCLTRTEHFSDTWYNGHYIIKGSNRKLEEEAYAAKPINQQYPITLIHWLPLTKHYKSKYFTTAYGELWDDGGSYGTFARNHSDDVVEFIPQAGEDLKIVGVFGRYGFKLQASDGKKGWMKCKDKKVQGFYQVMGYDAYDIFEAGDIMVAG